MVGGWSVWPWDVVRISHRLFRDIHEAILLWCVVEDSFASFRMIIAWSAVWIVLISDSRSISILVLGSYSENVCHNALLSESGFGTCCCEPLFAYSIGGDDSCFPLLFPRHGYAGPASHPRWVG